MAMPRMRYLITRIGAMLAATLGPDRDAAKSISVEEAERNAANGASGFRFVGICE